MEWTVVTVIVALVGLFITVGKPIVNLNQNLVTLNLRLEHMEKNQKDQDAALAKQAEAAHQSHEKLWDHNDEQDKRLDDHEHRLSTLEGEHRTYHRKEE